MIEDTAFEMRRKTLHVLVGAAFVFFIYYRLLEFWMVFAFLIIGIIISLISIKYTLPVISYFIMKYDRPEHSKTPAKGVISIFAAVCVLMLLLENGILSRDIVLASIMIWAIGDSLSSVIGKTYGRRKQLFSARFIEGTIAGIIGGTLGAWFFVPIYAAFPAALITMIIESFELKLLKHPIDDNILVPLLAALLLYFFV